MATRLLYTNSMTAGSIVDDLQLNSFNFTNVPLCSTTSNPNYVTHSTGGVVSAIAKDGSGNFYIGTNYSWYDGIQISNGTGGGGLAKWNGTSWSSLGTGPIGGTHGGRIYAMCRVGNYIYMAGLFTSVSGTSATNIIRYDTVGNTWAPLGSGLNGRVYALATDGTNLYAGGEFSTPYTNFAKWDGSAWSNVGTPNFDGIVRAIRVVSASEIYVGGSFSTPYARIAKWNGSAWSTLGSGIAGSGYVTGIALDGTGQFATVYVCGTFTQAAGNAASYFMKWYPSWSAVGTAPNQSVDSVEVWNGNVFVIGSFTTIGGVSASKIAKWNGSVWSGTALGVGIANVNNNVDGKFMLDGSQLYVHGYFSGAGGLPVNGLARFAVNSSGNNAWARLSTVGIPYCPLDAWYRPTAIYCIAKDSSGNKYIGGSFTSIGGHADWVGLAAKAIAKWNGSAWSTMGTGLTYASGDPAHVYTIVADGTTIYIGGAFDRAGGNTANYAVRWNGSNYSPMGSGPAGPVSALAVIGTDVYAGLSGVSPGLQKWMAAIPTLWSTVGSTGLDDPNQMQSPTVFSLLVVGSDLWIGGSIGYADGMQVNHVVKWNGSNYVSAGSGNTYFDLMGDTVMCLAYANSTLYAAGNLMVFNNFAKLSGTAWVYGDNTNFTGLDNYVRSMVSSPSNTLPLYLSGDFANAGPVAANKVASWNGTSWTGLATSAPVTPYSVARIVMDSYTDSTAPTAGGSGTLTTSNVTHNSLTLSWTKATDNSSQQSALSYRAYYSLSSSMNSVANIESFGTAVGTSYTPDIATINVTGLTASTTYYLNVIVKDEAGNKTAYTMKTQVTAAPPDTTGPMPGDSGTITSASVAETSLTLNWTKATDNVSSQANLQYLAYYSTSSSFDTIGQVEAGNAIGTYAADINTKPVTGLSAATTYYFNVIVKDEAGNKSVYTKKMQATADLTAPVVGNSGTITTASVTETSLTLNWTKATDSVSAQANLQYLAYYSTSSSFDTIGQVEAGTAVGTYTADINTKPVTGLSAGTIYYFNVIVKDEAGNKAVYAKVQQATPDITSPVVGNSGIITYSNVTPTSLTLNWTAATDNVSTPPNLQYLAYYSASSSFDTIGQVEAGSAIGTYTSDITTKNVTNLTPASQYYFNVIVKDGAGNKAVYAKVLVIFETTVIDGDNATVGNGETATWGSIGGGLTLTASGEILSGGEVVLQIASLDDLTGIAYFIEVKPGASLTFSGETIIPKSGTVYRLRPRT